MRMEGEVMDALLVVDLQADFMPGGALGVPDGDRVIGPLNRCLDSFARRGLPVFASRDWHPAGHCSFRERGGPWPAHCVAGTPGAAFVPGLRLPPGTPVVSKAADPEREAYSAFDGTGLEALLRRARVGRLFLGGLATEYCVLYTGRDALRLGFQPAVLEGAVAAISAPDGERALAELAAQGAVLLDSEEVAGWKEALRS